MRCTGLQSPHDIGKGPGGGGSEKRDDGHLVISLDP